MLRPALKSFLVGASFAAGIGLVSAVAANLASFSSGTPISSAQMNANFQALNSELDQLRGELVAAKVRAHDGSVISVAGVFKLATVTTTKGRITYPGKLGYAAAKKICEIEAGSESAHMCTPEEMVRSAQLGVMPAPGVYGWIASGHTQRARGDTTYVVANDCLAFVNDQPTCGTTTECYGTGFGPTGPTYQLCDTVGPILCCD